jgi:phosphatidylserine/phosphatidylglycerophosphate/cardiolipin synthase-like enzyme
MTFNLTPKYYSSSRDFGIIDKDAPDVSAIESTFNDDWQDKKVTAQAGDNLVWSPGSEKSIINRINQAKTSLKIYNEEMADTKVVNALGVAALRGVRVQIVMTDSSEWHANFSKLKSDGATIKTLASNASLYIHAKIIVVDNTSAFVGSENFSTTSLTRNRELGLVTTDKPIISNLDATFSSDLQNATPY